MASSKRSSRYHLPFFCPKDLENSTFYGVSNGKFIYKCKTCKRAFSDADAIGVTDKDKKEEEENVEGDYAYSAPMDGEDSSASSLLRKRQTDQKKNLGAKAKETLRDAAIKLEKARYVSVMKKIDRYGGGLDSPQFRPKTVAGGIISLLFIGAMLAIIIINIIKLAQGARSIVTQGTIQINHYEQSFKGSGIIPINGSQMDFPVMNLAIQNNIIFFNTGNPSVQKIEMIDNTHFNPTWDTHNENPPTTRSIYTKVAVPYDSISDPLFKGVHSSRDIDIDTVWKASLPSYFSESMESLQLLEMEAEYENKQFFPHDAVLFIRFQESDMATVLPYQLDVSLVNGGEVLVRKGKDIYNNDWMSSLSTLVKAPETWNFTWSMQDEGNGFNLLEMKGSLYSLTQMPSVNASDTNSFLDWRFVLLYTSNFNYTNPSKWYCFDYPPGGLTNVTQIRWDKIEAYARAPSDEDTTLQLMYGDFTYDGPLPADMYIWNLQRIEKVILNSIDTTTKILNISRPHPVDFATFSTESGCVNNKLPTINSAVPDSWQCDDSWYLDNWCDCGCGAIDPMCAMCQQQVDQCLVDGWDEYLGYCSYQTSECSQNVDYSGTLVAVGMVCSSLLIPGDDYLRGYYGSMEQYRQATADTPIGQCPGDTWYEEEPNMMSDGTIMCNAITETVIFFDQDESQFITIPVPPFPTQQFLAQLDMGSQSIQLSANVSDNYTADFADLPYHDMTCMTAQDEQFFSMGFLVSPLHYGQMKIFVIPSEENRDINETNFFPPSGVYVVADKSLSVGFLKVAGAACPNSDIYSEQIVMLADSPTTAQLQNSVGTFAYLNQPAGLSNVLEINTTSNFSFSALFGCCNTPIYAVVGNNEVVRITNVERYTTDPAPVAASCDASCPYVTRERLTLDKPLTGFYQVGAPVETTAYNPCDSSKCVYNGNYLLLSMVTDMTTVRADDPPYQPTQRASSIPPTELNVEVALFIVPKRNDFSTFLNLCNGTGVTPVPQDPHGWQLVPDRMEEVIDCELDDPPDTTVLCEAIDCQSLKRMPPTKGLKFEHILPLNERWVRPTSPEALLNTPEYYMDVSVVYYFDYTEMDLQVGRAFSANAMHDGDVNQNGEKKKFNGELEFIGRANGTDEEAAYYPAPAPIFFMDTVLYADKEKTNSMIDSFYMGYRRFMGWNDETVNRFGNVSFSWPGVGPLDLQPGYNYTFTASITIQPVYNVGPLEGASLDYWINSTSTSFSQIKTESNSNKAVCRLILTVNKDASVLYNRTTFTLTDFIASVGSAVALLSIGLSILGVWQNVTGVYPDEEEEAEAEAKKDIPLSTGDMSMSGSAENNL